MTAETYFLSKDAFLCADYRHCVILDVIRNRYLCIDRREFDQLAPWLHGWKPQPSTRTGAHIEYRPDCLASELVDKGILRTGPQDAKAVQTDSFTTPQSSLASSSPDLTGWTHIAHAPAFFLACAKAQVCLEARTFESIVRTTKEIRPGSESRSVSVGLDKMARLVAIFNSLRLYYPHPRASKCLFDSLALLNFLARFRCFPGWIFGVRMEPFHAHCWVQEGSIVVNDTVERVSRFTPIMKV